MNKVLIILAATLLLSACATDSNQSIQSPDFQDSQSTQAQEKAQKMVNI
jgi:uncharacterized lipoprotein YajG